jgi:hypothetical protein
LSIAQWYWRQLQLPSPLSSLNWANIEIKWKFFSQRSFIQLAHLLSVAQKQKQPDLVETFLYNTLFTTTTTHSHTIILSLFLFSQWNLFNIVQDSLSKKRWLCCRSGKQTETHSLRILPISNLQRRAPSIMPNIVAFSLRGRLTWQTYLRSLLYIR